MPVRPSFKKWIIGFGALGGAMFFYPHDNDNNKLLHMDKSRISSSSWDYNWDRLYSLLLLLPIKTLLASQYNDSVQLKFYFISPLLYIINK